MKNKLFSNVYTFLNTDVKNEAETKELAVLIRILSLVFSLYYLTISLIVTTINAYFLSMLLVFGIGLLTGTFICTFENRTRLALGIFTGTVLVMSFVSCMLLKWTHHFQLIMFLTILLFFFDVEMGFRSKITYSTIICMGISLLTAYSLNKTVNNSYNLTITDYLIEIINIVLFGACLVTVSHFFSIKYTKSEEKILQYNKKLIQMASIDTLTGLQNRRSMNDHLKELIYSYQRSNKQFSIAIGDIDLFKRVNDEYGHDAGDYVLTTLSNFFMEFMHENGTVARWGGEEFLFTFERMNADEAFVQLETLRHLVNHTQIKYKEYNFLISMTFGLEEFSEHFGIETVISNADSKLYQGKESGRNRVIY